MKRYLRAYGMCRSMFCAIPSPYQGWEEEARPLMLLFLPLVGLELGIYWALAGWLCWQCVDIWRDGSAPENLGPDGLLLADIYTSDDVAERLAPLTLAIPAYVVLVIGALVAGTGRRSRCPFLRRTGCG